MKSIAMWRSYVTRQLNFTRGFLIGLLFTTGLQGSWAAQLIYTSYEFTTPAGMPGRAGYWDAPVGSGAVFNHPSSVAVDGSNNVYVADANNAVVRKLKPAGTNWAVSTLTAGAMHPYALALDLAGNIYVADRSNGVVRLTLSGTNWVASTLSTNCLSLGIAVDRSTNVYVNDGNAVILKIAPSGVVTPLAGLAGATGTNDGVGSVARFNHPCGLAVDLATNVYVADSGNHTIRKITPLGVVTTLAGVAKVAGGFDGTSSVGLFNGPRGVAVDLATNVYVADYNNHTIRRISPAGVVTTVAGLYNLSGSANGAGNAARFCYPEGIATGNGVLYVADSANNTIRRGIITAPVIVPHSIGYTAPHTSFSLTGLPGQPVVVLGSTNLLDWVPLWTNTLDYQAISFSDSRTNRFPRYFYRAAIAIP